MLHANIGISRGIERFFDEITQTFNEVKCQQTHNVLMSLLEKTRRHRRGYCKLWTKECQGRDVVELSGSEQTIRNEYILLEKATA